MASIAAVPACQELFMNRMLSRFPVPKHNFYGYSRQQQTKNIQIPLKILMKISVFIANYQNVMIEVMIVTFLLP